MLILVGGNPERIRSKAALAKLCPTRRQERQMQRFKSPAQARRSLSAHGMVYGHFHPRRDLMSAAQYRRERARAFRVWREETCAQAAA